MFVTAMVLHDATNPINSTAVFLEPLGAGASHVMTFSTVTLDWLKHRRSPLTTSRSDTGQIDARFVDTTKMRFRKLNSSLSTRLKSRDIRAQRRAERP